MEAKIMPRMKGDLFGKAAFVTGASGGLGKAIAMQMASRGCHITLFARRWRPLQAARDEIRANCADPQQEVTAIVLDLGDAERVEEVFLGQPRIPDFLFCSAGGNYAENGFLLDITAGQLESCMKNNYFSSAFAAKAMLGIWTNDDTKKVAESCAFTHRTQRKIILVSSAAAFVCLPGSIAYSPAKCAQRALADTLRMEVMRYDCSYSQYSIHCAFPADFVSPGFRAEQESKTLLTKRLQGLDKPLHELEASLPSSQMVANLIISAVDRGRFVICEDSWASSTLFTAMTGPSPKRGLGIYDAVCGLVASWMLWPILRSRWERTIRAYVGKS